MSSLEQFAQNGILKTALVEGHIPQREDKDGRDCRRTTYWDIEDRGIVTTKEPCAGYLVKDLTPLGKGTNT